jgi:hypothetical protein
LETGMAVRRGIRVVTEYPAVHLVLSELGRRRYRTGGPSGVKDVSGVVDRNCMPRRELRSSPFIYTCTCTKVVTIEGELSRFWRTDARQRRRRTALGENWRENANLWVLEI